MHKKMCLVGTLAGDDANGYHIQACRAPKIPERREVHLSKNTLNFDYGAEGLNLH